MEDRDSTLLTVRFARENGLDVSAVLGESDLSRKSDPYRLLAGAAVSNRQPVLRQITALRIDRPLRFGNSVIQLSNAIDLALSHGIGRIYVPGFWWISPLTSGHVAEIELCCEDAAPDEVLLSGCFYYKQSLRPLYPDRPKTIEEFRGNLLRARVQIPLLDAPPPLPDDHLVIHIRSGDVFEDRGHPLYGQPPLAFYTLILRKAPWRQVTLVSEDRRNPVIDRLLQSSGPGLPPVVHRQASLEADLQLLLRARSLAGSLGTFMPAVLALSGNVRRVLCFGGLWYGATLRTQADLFVVKDLEGHYSRSVLASNWRNDPFQRALMLDYPETALGLVQLPRQRPNQPPRAEAGS
jgi:hypothetical protein